MRSVSVPFFWKIERRRIYKNNAVLSTRGWVGSMNRLRISNQQMDDETWTKRGTAGQNLGPKILPPPVICSTPCKCQQLARMKKLHSFLLEVQVSLRQKVVTSFDSLTSVAPVHHPSKAVTRLYMRFQFKKSQTKWMGLNYRYSWRSISWKRAQNLKEFEINCQRINWWTLWNGPLSGDILVSF